MKVVFINSPLQGDSTLSPQVIDGKIPYWCVKSEMLKAEETFQQWWARKQEWMGNHSKGEKLVEGIYFYDMQSIAGMEGKSSMIVRYDWIKTQNEEE